MYQKNVARKIYVAKLYAARRVYIINGTRERRTVRIGARLYSAPVHCAQAISNATHAAQD